MEKKLIYMEKQVSQNALSFLEIQREDYSNLISKSLVPLNKPQHNNGVRG